MPLSQLSRLPPSLNRPPIASVDELRAEAGDDWDHIVAEPDRLAAYVRLVAITRARQEGKTPDHYTATTSADGAGRCQYGRERQRRWKGVLGATD